eukprot:CAMPEP_0185259472 /NCGR_PEP_ID=MMETSP1359-20130426/8237_1 /TAXON_ID=552665 /ORGANISM="Bigelowiella longifila, Strain CCMP242" /LENGTH=198 /DNA_ID=CAMNT_0027845387 /DNA_START=536 /DNA_END=1132 /DNA_ORIENTATION=+
MEANNRSRSIWSLHADDVSRVLEEILGGHINGGEQEDARKIVKNLAQNFGDIHKSWKLFEEDNSTIEEGNFPPFPKVPPANKQNSIEKQRSNIILPGEKSYMQPTGFTFTDYIVNVARNNTDLGLRLVSTCYIRWHPDKVVPRLKSRCKSKEMVSVMKGAANNVSRTLTWLKSEIEKWAASPQTIDFLQQRMTYKAFR